MTAIPTELVPIANHLPPAKTSRSDRQDPPDEGSGVFREALLCWLFDDRDVSALRQVGRLLAAALEPYQQGSGLSSRVRLHAIAAEMDFLSRFLADGVDERGRSTLAIVDWELAKEAALAARSLEVWSERLRAEMGIRGPLLPAAVDWEDAYSLRETVLWPVRDRAEGRALRHFGQMLWEAIRDTAPPEPLPSSSFTAHQLRAAALDIEHLSSFTAQTGVALAPSVAITALERRLTNLSRSLLEAACLKDP